MFIVGVQSRVVPEVKLSLDCTVLEANNKFHNGLFCDKVQISDIEYWVRVQIIGALLLLDMKHLQSSTLNTYKSLMISVLILQTRVSE